MKTFKKEWSQKIYADLSVVWDFFSRPENLNTITPKDMSFRILTDVNGVEMYEGFLIDYKVSPFPLTNFSWQTEIIEIEAKKKFIDVQRKGPFALWHHEHQFEQKDDHVLMKDILHYRPPFGLVGRLGNWLFLDRRVESIFSYRYEIIEDLFNQKKMSSSTV